MSRNTGNYYSPHPAYIKPNEAIELLKKGHKLTTPGKDLNTLSANENGYKWVGLYDQAPTILTEEQAKQLIPKYQWIIDL